MERERLTITLRKDILKLVDQSIDGAKLRNRSHAIEYFLSLSLSPRTVKVVVVLNTIMRTSYQAGYQTSAVRGQLTPVGTADAKDIFRSLSDQNFTEVILAGTDNIALQAAAIDAGKFDLSTKTVTVDASGAAAEVALDQLSELLRDEPFVYWDTRFIGNINLSSLLEFHKAAKTEATAALLQADRVGQESPSGMMGQLYGSQLVGLSEQTAQNAGGLSLAGVFVFEPSIFAKASSRPRNLYRDILPVEVSEGQLSGFAFVADKKIDQPVTAAARR